MEKYEYIDMIKQEFPHLEDFRVNQVYEIAKRELFITLYSANTSVVNENTQIPYIYEFTVLEAMQEIINIGNMKNFTSYQENGWSWERPSNGLQTYSNIKPKVMGF